jgi:hypothetical protein
MFFAQAAIKPIFDACQFFVDFFDLSFLDACCLEVLLISVFFLLALQAGKPLLQLFLSLLKSSDLG